MDKNTTLLLYFHGSREDSLMACINTTRWIERVDEYNFTVVFGQATGIIERPHEHKEYRGISYGDLYWKIRQHEPQY